MNAARAALLAALIALPAQAQQPAVPVSRGEFAYAGYIAGFNVFDVHAAVELRPDGYQLGLAFRTVGLVGAVLHGDMLSHAQGAWVSGRVVPQHYRSGGLWRGLQRAADIEYPDGQPHIVTLVPEQDSPRDPVPEAMRQNTADALSSMAFLLHTVATTGGCEGQVNTFDGRRVTTVTVHTAGTEILPLDNRSIYAGPTLRCDIEGRQLAGFPLDAGPDDMLRKPQHSSVWLATLQPGLPPVPVLMSFEIRVLGHMTLYVTKIEEGAKTGRFNPALPSDRP
jgi:hypothetical protein